ncbi:MAG TPA: HD domain-containing phosphohydrolase [Thermoanaerobaculia bacterium]|jgi:HD-GYP domain-containing protein (c-di-GMP phosphodiesterase class II)|nr:HD domain-containing phosphohydrolase [Thermoanaerobaculia bacterium]
MQTLTLLHSETFPIGLYADVLTRESIASSRLDSLEQLLIGDASLRVVLVDRNITNGHSSILNIDPRTAVVGVGLAEQPRWVADDSIYLQLPANPSTAVLLNAVKRAYQFLYQKQRADQLEHQLTDRTRELQQVAQVGVSLSTVRDHSVLLTMILSKARELSRSDAGSLYLLDEQGGRKVLRWKLAQNDSIDVEGFEEKILPITRKSLAGYVAMTGETLVIDDAYDLPADAEYEINRSFDEQNGYLTRSLLVFPMTNHAGDVIGVLQLINRKRVGAPARLTAANVPENVISFRDDTSEIMRALASQAAVAVENNLLYESIERLFEGFVTAAVTAIEQRDPTTSGHSFRVADLTVELARVIDRIDSGMFADVRFTVDQVREIRYASLLHDFGKVGVREQVLIKEKKLYPMQLETIRGRFEYVMKSVENDTNRRKIDYLLANGRNGYDEFTAQVDADAAAQILKLQKDFAFISQSNEPTVLPEGDFEYLQQLAGRDYEDIRGDRRRLVDQEEARILSIRKGNLDAAERVEIESHVTHTFNFLMKIPWTRDLAKVADIAYAHHEKLNGRGYPRKLSAGDIPLQSRMMAISDIYDALTASDRPYKRAISTDRALDILKMEVNDGLLDPALVDTFIETKVYERAGVLRT